MENNQRNSRKRLNSLILLVAFTAVMLIVSTYAWFSTQKNVTLGKLSGKVEVAEGLQISLDALNWRNDIDLSDAGIAAYFATSNAENSTDYDLDNPYNGRTNLVPDELLPVSTTAQSGEGIGQSDIKMYAGEVNNTKNLLNIKQMANDNDSGFFAIDFFLWNTSGASTTPDPIRLETNSLIKLDTASKESSGLQNSIRVAFALFENPTATATKVDASTGAQSQANILEGTNGTIKDVAIWEPNASGLAVEGVVTYPAHVPEIVTANGKIVTIDGTTQTFTAGTEMPTFALTAASAAANETITPTDLASPNGGKLNDLYKWGTTGQATGVVKQHTLKTTTSGVTTPTQLVSAADGTTNFTIAANQYHKLRMYIWLEGQDVDCINYASLGGGFKIDVGLSKPGSNNS